MIATRAAEQDITSLSWIDYLLMGTACGLAVFSGVMAVSASENLPITLSLVGVGAVLSAVLQARLSEKFAQVAGGLVYLVLTLGCFFAWRSVNVVLPNPVFTETRELAPAGFLVWMIIFGGFATWRDQTLLFQAVPCIAIFGLVGCYDTYRPAPFLFFVFLICLCTLFARAHARTMLLQAAESGYQAQVAKEAIATGDPASAHRWVDAIRRGPWKWVAGPEWALASAATVVLFSLLGAPVIQRSVSGVSGFVRLRVPTPPPPQNQGPRLFNSGRSVTGSTAIGRGPNRLSDQEMFRASLDQVRYLRGSTYFRYNGLGWDLYRSVATDAVGRTLTTLLEDSKARIKDPQTITWSIERLGDTGNFLPIPGELESTTAPRNLITTNPDGTLSVVPRVAALPPIGGTSIVANTNTEPTDAVSVDSAALDPAIATEYTSDKVVETVQKIAEQGGTDYEKAMRWKAWIAEQVVYNLNAAATPQGVEPVDHFLFTSKEGYCDLFASSMVLGARVLKIPARYVVGFLPDNERDAQGRIIVRERDAHAWAELYFEGHGWVVFDATEGAREVPGGGRGDSNFHTPWYEQEWARYLLLLVALAGVGGAVMFAYRGHLREVAAIDPRRRALQKEYDAFAKILSKASGTLRNSSLTPNEFFEQSRPSLGPAEPTAEEINRAFVRLMYSSDDLDSEKIAELKSRIKELAGKVPKSKPKTDASG